MQVIQEETQTTTRRVFIVDDHPIVRDGLAVQISNLPDVTLCGQAEDVVEAMALIPNAKPDLIIVDISLKNSNGIELVKRLIARDGSLRILVWSMYPESLYAERALRAGAQGYVNKGQRASEIMKAVQAELDGKPYLSDEMSIKLLGRMVVGEDQKINHFSIDALTDRELEAFDLLGKGHTTKMIATKMHVVSPKSVETYRARIKEKLGLSKATELMQHAVQWAMGKDREEPTVH